VARLARRVLPLTKRVEGKHFFVREEGKLRATPLFLVLVLVEATDLMFAVDSIPAIFSITRDPFLVYTSNIFAVLGLRSLYFLLAHVVQKFHLLRFGLAVILVFIGLKMLGERWVHVPIGISLGVVAGVLALSVAASLAFPPPPAAVSLIAGADEGAATPVAQDDEASAKRIASVGGPGGDG
jgi:tellurite resistance protein TerC